MTMTEFAGRFATDIWFLQMKKTRPTRFKIIREPKQMKWKIEGTVESALDPDDEALVISGNVEAETAKEALGKFTATLHQIAARRGWRQGQYNVRTNDPKPA